MHACRSTAIMTFILLLLLVLLAALPAIGRIATQPTAPTGPGYLTQLSTDKPIYRLGERVYVRGVLLDGIEHRPLADSDNHWVQVEIKGPKGESVSQGTTKTKYSTFGYGWDIPSHLAGGVYRVVVRYPHSGHPPAERTFDIRAYRAPRLKTQIEFVRDGYGPGDEVQASLSVTRAEGGFPTGAKVTVTARVDGEEVYTGQVTVDGTGHCTTAFTLPEQIDRGQGTLSFAIEDGGIVETAAKTIPILLNKIDLQIYPEGGDLVVSLPARVYIEARTPADKPADIAGIVVDAQGNTVTEFRTEHEGRGRFAFTPQPGGQYTLKINKPSGIETAYPLPAVKEKGAVIRSVENTYEPGAPVRLKVAGREVGPLVVTLSKRDRELSAVRIQAEGQRFTEIQLTPPLDMDGVLVATVWDENDRPLAERLIFRRPTDRLHIAITADKERYVPGEGCSLSITTTNDRGRPVSAVVGLTVTDDSVLEMIDKREQAPRLPVMVLLEDDVRELADAHVYLDPDNDQAPLAVDLLLGTQGWRRFACVDPKKFMDEYKDDARRVLAYRFPVPTYRRNAGAWGGQEEAEVLFGIAAGVDKDDNKWNFEGQRGLPQAPPMVELFKAGDQNEPVVNQPVAEEKAEVMDLIMPGRRKPAPPCPPADVFYCQMPYAVRVYAHKIRPNRQPNDRKDFTETLYWHTGLKTDDQGQANVSFALSDAVTAFRVLADGFTTQGTLGASDTTIESVQPFYIEPKMPLEVTQGDRILLPVGMVNGLDHRLTNLNIAVQCDPNIAVAGAGPISLGPNQRGRTLFDLQVGQLNNNIDIIFSTTAGQYSDRITRPLRVVPRGFPVESAFGGQLEPSGKATHAVVIPADVVASSITTNIEAYPTPLGNLASALESLIREPYGCFEQTSSTVYPLILAQFYFINHANIDPALIERSNAMLDKGYNKLIGFECPSRGYEWFGGDPGHEALTAYGLLEFHDLAQVRAVDQQMVQRTRDWLLARRDGKGGFDLNSKALDSFGRAPQNTTNAYVVWSLLRTGQTGLETEINAVIADALESKDSYIIALAANIAHLAGQKEQARTLMQRLADRQGDAGHIEGAVTSITRSGGQSLTIETTALTALAWLKDAAYSAPLERALHYIHNQCSGGSFGSTQSTVLALHAIVEYDKARANPTTPGAIQVMVDGQPVGEPVPFDQNTQGAIKLPDISHALTPGSHEIALCMTDGSAMPYSLSVGYHALTPPSADKCALDIEVSLKDAEVQEGSVTEANVVVTNVTDQGLPTPIAIVGLPGGLEPRHDQLKELVKAGTIAAYEVRGREVILYWRQLQPKQKVELPLSLVAAVPGTYTAPASRAYLYYTDEYKCWRPGLSVEIAPR